MTLREMFKKVETYNEIAELMRTDKASIYFAERVRAGIICSGQHFRSYSDLSKYIRREFFKEVADKLLKADNWEIDGEMEISFAGRTFTYLAELSAN